MASPYYLGRDEVNVRKVVDEVSKVSRSDVQLGGADVWICMEWSLIESNGKGRVASYCAEKGGP